MLQRDCQICEARPARWDAPIVGGGPWAYMCQQCYGHYARKGSGTDLTTINE